jgi:hypothetical protein
MTNCRLVTFDNNSCIQGRSLTNAGLSLWWVNASCDWDQSRWFNIWAWKEEMLLFRHKLCYLQLFPSFNQYRSHMIMCDTLFVTATSIDPSTKKRWLVYLVLIVFSEAGATGTCSDAAEWCGHGAAAVRWHVRVAHRWQGFHSHDPRSLKLS